MLNSSHWAAEVCCTRQVSSHVLGWNHKTETWQWHISLFYEVAVLYSQSVVPRQLPCSGAAVTVTLNSDRVQASCLEEGREGGGWWSTGTVEGERWLEVVSKISRQAWFLLSIAGAFSAPSYHNPLCIHAHTHRYTHSLSPWSPPVTLRSWTTWSEVIVLTVSARNRLQVSTTWGCSYSFTSSPCFPHHLPFPHTLLHLLPLSQSSPPPSLSPPPHTHTQRENRAFDNYVDVLVAFLL